MTKFTVNSAEYVENKNVSYSVIVFSIFYINSTTSHNIFGTTKNDIIVSSTDMRSDLNDSRHKMVNKIINKMRNANRVIEKVRGSTIVHCCPCETSQFSTHFEMEDSFS